MIKSKMKNKIVNKPRKFTEIEGSKIKVQEIVEEFIGDDGRTYSKLDWRTTDSPTSLGSIAEPNKKILQIKIEVPDPNKNPFKLFFK